MHKIEAVILYCSNDYKFFEKCISNLLSIGIKCNVVTYSNFYAGEKENMGLLDKSFDQFKNKNVTHSHLLWKEGFSSLYWEAYGRWYATNLVSKESEYILYIDPDELIEPGNFLKWLDTEKYRQYSGMKLRQYMYSFSPCHRLKVKAFNTVMAKREYAQSLPLQIQARFQYFNNTNRISRWKAKLGINSKFYIYKGQPFIHHYTGARTKEEMLIKVANWSHNKDRSDWKDVIENTFKVSNNKIGSHHFEVVEDYFCLNGLPQRY